MTSIDLPDNPVDLARLQDAVAEKLARVSLDGLSNRELLDVVQDVERSHRRRRDASAGLIPMFAFTGEKLDSPLPATAAAVADGDLSLEHVTEIVAMVENIPAAIPAEDKARAEAQLAEVARTLTPEGTRTAGKRILAHLDPDGELTDDADRARTRGVTLAPQDRRLMSAISARLTPAARAKLEALLVLWAAPGMNNPDDPQSPSGAATTVDPAALAAARERDTRTQAQRNHDAPDAMWTVLLEAGGLGESTGLPAHLVVTAALGDLESRSGVAVTATGTRMPVKDLVEIAADATPWLEVFGDASSQVLYLGRGSVSRRCRSGWRCSVGIVGAPRPAAPCRGRGPRPTTCLTGPTVGRPTSITSAGRAAATIGSCPPGRAGGRAPSSRWVRSPVGSGRGRPGRTSRGRSTTHSNPRKHCPTGRPGPPSLGRPWRSGSAAGSPVHHRDHRSRKGRMWCATPPDMVRRGHRHARCQASMRARSLSIVAWSIFRPLRT
ncbi:DUF222 domain-containing protein [Gordonia sp. (in: high G+C Gram-positive bacteria)]|uniref:DUF222 domain-containing protein n=1 Tax=Gordonia sp. (in: high G+C Gram-positive bacteria) TaxID=84139 RepID=UPI00334018BC